MLRREGEVFFFGTAIGQLFGRQGGFAYLSKIDRAGNNQGISAG
jgi:hypothetical protein